MREILFRGKLSGVGDRWAYGILIEQNEVTNTILEHGWSECLVIPESVGQFTGTYDKNNVRIFEGDIVKIKNVYNEDLHIMYDGNYPVVFKKGAFWLYDKSFLDNEGLDLLGSYIENYIEVVGNIYDNPELLKEE